MTHFLVEASWELILAQLEADRPFDSPMKAHINFIRPKKNPPTTLKEICQSKIINEKIWPLMLKSFGNNRQCRYGIFNVRWAVEQYCIQNKLVDPEEVVAGPDFMEELKNDFQRFFNQLPQCDCCGMWTEELIPVHLRDVSEAINEIWLHFEEGYDSLVPFDFYNLLVEKFGLNVAGFLTCDLRGKPFPDADLYTHLKGLAETRDNTGLCFYSTPRVCSSACAAKVIELTTPLILQCCDDFDHDGFKSHVQHLDREVYETVLHDWKQVIEGWYNLPIMPVNPAFVPLFYSSPLDIPPPKPKRPLWIDEPEQDCDEEASQNKRHK